MVAVALLAVLVSLWLGAEMGAGVRRSRPVAVLRACWPIVALVVVLQLAKLASNTNDQGGDVTDQSVTGVLAIVQLLLYGVAALGGRIYRLAVGARATLDPAANVMAVSGFRNRLAARPTLTVARPRTGSRFWKVVGIGIAALVLGLIVLGFVKLVQEGDHNNRPYPHSTSFSVAHRSGSTERRSSSPRDSPGATRWA
jgi:hypothetical protein